jgi:hypothetical protein
VWGLAHDLPVQERMVNTTAYFLWVDLMMEAPQLQRIFLLGLAILPLASRWQLQEASSI